VEELTELSTKPGYIPLCTAVVRSGPPSFIVVIWLVWVTGA
jgi:hypothetical protein